MCFPVILLKKFACREQIKERKKERKKGRNRTKNRKKRPFFRIPFTQKLYYICIMKLLTLPYEYLRLNITTVMRPIYFFKVLKVNKEKKERKKSSDVGQ